MKITFRMETMEKAFEAGWADAYDDRWNEYRSGLWEMHDGVPVRLVGVDGGEPEDNTLWRGWRWVAKELNALAEKVSV